ncbi:hypothetical protein [Streptomyces daliensis]|uniref:Secreted protein n=1 Tax=Streptomyces daliensis TaxID=299421 RepID=A0A8T4IU24_9ACTN|nr:hypothetical protein [Streptomyces daliensis]
MLWPMFFLALAFCGIAVLGVLAVRVGLEVRRFSRAVGDSAERITLAAEDLERAALPLAGRASRATVRPAPTTRADSADR